MKSQMMCATGCFGSPALLAGPQSRWRYAFPQFCRTIAMEIQCDRCGCVSNTTCAGNCAIAHRQSYVPPRTVVALSLLCWGANYAARVTSDTTAKNFLDRLIGTRVKRALVSFVAASAGYESSIIMSFSLAPRRTGLEPAVIWVRVAKPAIACDHL